MIAASRTLKVALPDETIDVPVVIHVPEPREGSWFSRVEIGWPDGEKVYEYGGADSLQALVTALQLTGANLYASSYHKQGQLFFSNRGDGYGFPVPSNFRSDLVGLDKLLM